MPSLANMASSSDDLAARFEHFFEQDAERAKLIKLLLEKTHEYKTLLENVNIELEHERESRTRYQPFIGLGADRLTDGQNQEPYVTVLVDGDGAIFRDELLQDPQKGAPEAAVRLRQAVRAYLKDTPLGTEHIPIIVRIFVNLNGLARSLYAAGVVDTESHMRTFAELFTNSRAEFDFVNVGHGKENADSKMRKMLSHYYHNIQCKKIFFAGCHDNGYLHELRQHEGDADAKERIVLLETTPAQPSFTSLNFAMTRFDSVFRTEPLTSDPRQRAAAAPLSLSPTKPAVEVHPCIRPASTPSPAPAESIASSGNGGISIKYPTAAAATSYATAGGTNGHQNISITSTKPRAPRVIDYNIHGQRLDPPNRHPGQSPDQVTYKEKFEKIKPKAFCNALYLTGRCERQHICPMEHGVKLTPGEVAIHRYKARTTLCPNGPECEIYSCYLSHHCPFGQFCQRGADCKFGGTMFGDLHFSKSDMEVE
ncbi:hypothetical protein EYZ11_000859 [Aspergillus tanneri]|uniref:C3H1-type domain-containing protein n=1 Tax=Aspergillus tanneri TaxID=1220188 RepID=A0A4S3JW58_9EURO|nr:hypothetical protein EYZ11_000859 [Aspergillus tanneri]